mmetsp:Transcript_89723/g.256449  ORF Transcript_89723/g.256449 Transcript_89723/m.256449 type:complete len:218 (+) Transcript_89723:177-830(+)
MLAQGPRRRSKAGPPDQESPVDGHSAHSLRARFVALDTLAAALAALPSLLRLISGEVVGDSAPSEAPGDEVGLALACFRLLGLPPRLLGLPLSPLNPLGSMPLYRGDSARPKLGTSSAPSLNAYTVRLLFCTSRTFFALSLSLTLRSFSASFSALIAACSAALACLAASFSASLAALTASFSASLAALAASFSASLVATSAAAAATASAELALFSSA